MRHCTTLAVVLTIAASAPGAAQQQQGAASSNAAKIASARSAAPPSIAAAATVAVAGADGKLVTLVKGTNGWLCLPDDPATPGPDPMCVDKTWQAWMSAYMAKKAPATKAIGIAYMLAGGSDASNTDPFAEKPSAGQKWITSAAHTMIIVPDAKQLDAYASDSNSPGPYVMWKGTPYAHLMVPVPTRK